MKRKSPYEQALERLNEYIDSHHRRHTPEREIVLQVVFEMPPFFTSQELEERCQEEHLSRATVFNTLDLLVAAQILRAVHRLQGKRNIEYELIVEAQPHMWGICQKCGRVFEMKDKVIERVVMEHKYGNFEPAYLSLVVYGKCRVCRIKKSELQLLKTTRRSSKSTK